MQSGSTGIFSAPRVLRQPVENGVSVVILLSTSNNEPVAQTTLI
ncbi:hypothetical protein ACNKHX_00405 [Shigella flexneri]